MTRALICEGVSLSLVVVVIAVYLSLYGLLYPLGFVLLPFAYHLTIHHLSPLAANPVQGSC